MKKNFRNYFLIDEVVEIEEVEVEDEYVYDISVEDTERFFARDPSSDGYILVHNTSMYPSLVKMFNIDFTTFRARVFPIQAWNLMRVLEKFANSVYKYVRIEKDENPTEKEKYAKQIKKYKLQLENAFEGIAKRFAEWYKPNKKNEFIRENIKFSKKILNDLMYIFAKVPFDEFLRGADYIGLKTRLIPLLENFSHLIAYQDDETNKLIYYWIITQGNVEEYKKEIFDYYKKLYSKSSTVKSPDDIRVVIQDYPTSPKTSVRIVSLNEFIEEYLKKYIVTITGAAFYKHDEKLGKMVLFINEYMSLRKQLKKLAAQYFNQGDIFKFNYYDKLQGKVVKPQLNAMSFGINSVPTFILNDKNIGNTITLSGRLMIKFAQYGVQHYFNNNLNTIIKNLAF